ncbi:hypothetical protein ACFWSF_24115 [Streptomyces sp. NPDC058611]|uniref:hypothetical protein n=1 Tax=unclassified Streptomyces TaxID=2593676 RepID=UPI00364B27E8
MSQTPQPSGVDLARVALRAAREAAKKTGARTAKSKPRLARTVRRDGCAPMGLGEAFTALMAERGWDIPAAGAGLCPPLTLSRTEPPRNGGRPSPPTSPTTSRRWATTRSAGS